MRTVCAQPNRQGFTVPPLLSRDEYAFLKMTLQTDSGFCLIPVVSIWTAFPGAKWLLSLAGILALAGAFLHVLLYGAALVIVILATYLFGSKSRRISDHFLEQSRRKRYSRQMKRILMDAPTYEDYLRQIVRI